MKGLALILAPKGGPKGEAEPSEETEESKTGSSEKEFARLASEAIAAGDHDAAADAIVSTIKACMRSYGPK